MAAYLCLEVDECGGIPVFGGRRGVPVFGVSVGVWVWSECLGVPVFGVSVGAYLCLEDE